VRHAIREFTNSLLTNLKHLLDYLHSLKKENPLQENFEQINLRPEMLQFKDIFLRNRWVGWTPGKVEEFFNHEYEKIQDSFNTSNLDNVIRILEERMASIKA